MTILEDKFQLGFRSDNGIAMNPVLRERAIDAWNTLHTERETEGMNYKYKVSYSSDRRGYKYIKFETLEEATAFCNEVFRETKTVLCIEAI